MTLADISDHIGYPHTSTKPRRFYELYEQYFSVLADQPVTLLELGVYTGESVKVWASYFTRGRVIGGDIEDHGADLTAYPNAIFERADQRDKERLGAICAKEAPDGLDIVIDDAAHYGSWSWQSYQILFSRLKPGGLYIVEDWGTGYFDDWHDGGHFSEPTLDFSENETPNRLPSHDYGMAGLVKRLVDEAIWQGIRPSLFAKRTRPRKLEWMHVHPEFVVLKKATALS